MLAIRIWNGAMALLTLLVMLPYLGDMDAVIARTGLAAVAPEGKGSFIVGFGMQGLAMGLYCLWGALSAKQAVDSLRFLTLYMACVSVGRGIAAVGFFSEPTSMPMIAFMLDTLITIIGGIILYRYLKSADPKAA